jgi:hypothetical protein
MKNQAIYEEVLTMDDLATLECLIEKRFFNEPLLETILEDDMLFVSIRNLGINCTVCLRSKDTYIFGNEFYIFQDVINLMDDLLL